MEKIVDSLLLRLCSRGLTDQEVPWLIRDVLNTLSNDSVLTLEHLKWNLSTLGWEKDVLDGHILELMLCLIEDDLHFLPQSRMVH